MYALDDTIAAIASPPGGAARGIIRVTGSRVRDCLEPLFRPGEPGKVPGKGDRHHLRQMGEPGKGDRHHLRQMEPVPFSLPQMEPVPFSLAPLTRPTAVPGLLWLPGLAVPLPCDLCLWPNQRSYTGQPTAEIHTFGSPPLLQAVLRAVCAAGARLAEPGEFTLRAFLTGRIDLTQAEAVLGVIDAGDDRQLHAALAQLAGGLAAPLCGLREELLDLLAHVEAGLDFADEDVLVHYAREPRAAARRGRQARPGTARTNGPPRRRGRSGTRRARRPPEHGKEQPLQCLGARRRAGLR